jgi:hypothetical protein
MVCAGVVLRATRPSVANRAPLPTAQIPQEECSNSLLPGPPLFDKTYTTAQWWVQMATLIKTASATWKVIRKTGWPMETKTFRTKRDADDWSRRTEDEMVRGVFIQRGAAKRTIFAEALERYVKEVTPIKKLTTQKAERLRVKPLTDFFGQYAMTAISADLVAR